MIISIKVKTNSKEVKIEKIKDNEYFVSLKNPAHENKANIELVKLLKKYFKSNVYIIKGEKSNKKIIEVENGNKI